MGQEGRGREGEGMKRERGGCREGRSEGFRKEMERSMVGVGREGWSSGGILWISMQLEGCLV